MIGCCNGCVVCIIDNNAFQKVVKVNLFTLALIETIAIIGSLWNFWNDHRIVKIAIFNN